MAIVITRTGVIAGSTSFQALSAVAGATVSSSFTIPQGVSAVKMLSIGQSGDGAGEELTGLVKLSGNAVKDGDAVFTGVAANVSGTSTGSFMGNMSYDTDIKVQAGNSMEISYAQVGSTASVDLSVTLQFN